LGEELATGAAMAVAANMTMDVRNFILIVGCRLQVVKVKMVKSGSVIEGSGEVVKIKRLVDRDQALFVCTD
jgi:hypothetical protein